MTRLPLITATAAVAIAAALAAGTTAAKADLILTFGQTGGGSPFVATNPTAGTTHLSVATQPVQITQIFGNVPTINPAIFTFSADSVGAATNSAGSVNQAYSGSFSITAGAANYLSGTFTDALFGSGTGLTFTASNATAGESISFTSNVIPVAELGNPEALSLSLANVSPPAGTTNPINCSGTTGCTIAAFTSSVGGTASSTPTIATPEPASLALLGGALAGLGVFYRRRKYSV